MKKQLSAVLFAACVLGIAVSSVEAGLVVTDKPFTGDASNNWGWESKTDANTQLSGTDQLTYTYLGTTASATNAKAYLRETITDAADVFPTGVGAITMRLRVDLTNYPTGVSDFTGVGLMELGNSAGNKSHFSGGMISRLNVAGFNTPGQLRFGLSNSAVFTNGGNSSSSVMSFGTNPNNIPLIFDVAVTTTVSGAPGAWTIVTEGSAYGPLNAAGDMGTLTLPAITYNSTNATWGGLKDANSYFVGFNPSTGTGSNAVVAGSSITVDSFSVDPIPEPVALGSLAMAGLLLGRRRQRA